MPNDIKSIFSDSSKDPEVEITTAYKDFIQKLDKVLSGTYTHVRVIDRYIFIERNYFDAALAREILTLITDFKNCECLIGPSKFFKNGVLIQIEIHL